MTQAYSGSCQRIGDYAEYLVACDLIAQGYRIHMASPGSHYDIILDDNGRLYRIQVKGSLKPKRENSYKFNIHAKKKHTHYDIIALVAIDKKLIAYDLPPPFNEKYLSIGRFEALTAGKAIEKIALSNIENINQSEDSTL